MEVREEKIEVLSTLVLFVSPLPLLQIEWVLEGHHDCLVPKRGPQGLHQERHEKCPT